MKARILHIERRHEDGLLIRNACPRVDCSGSVGDSSHEKWSFVEAPYSCRSCGEEVSVKIDGDKATVRLPYGSDLWRSVKSSNIAAGGQVKEHLLIKFNKGDVYLYRDMGHYIHELLGAESVGKFFARVIRSSPATRLCRNYGCKREALKDFDWNCKSCTGGRY